MKNSAPITVLLLSGLLLSCRGGEAPRRWAENVIEANQRVERALSRGDMTEAAEALRALTALEAPAGIDEVDARGIRQDASFRLALLRLEAGDAEGAKSWAEVGLKLGEGEDHFTANLLIARGRAYEALGDARGAARDYHAALRINEALMNQALQGGGVEHHARD
ncbi:hypothetical protein KKF91_04085 [Myxococcota bacterium]|nr:hypothetical protein [Myxococcota bacterium]MBU1429724.1 hypothetical protein [Myxococcota bacterium]MBU1898327.1 hypothetical protein [Myxococcota bacterium]